MEMDKPSPDKIYKFDEPFLQMFRIRFLHRKSPTAPVKIQNLKRMYVASIAAFSYIICFLMKLITFAQGTHMELAEAGEVAAIASVFVISFCRGMTLLVHQVEVERLLLNLENIFPTTKKDQLEHKLHEYANTIILRNQIMKLCCAVGCTAFLSKPILKSLFDVVFAGERYIYRYPFITWHPFGETWLTYILTYLAQTYAGLTGVFFLLNEDLIFTTSVTHMCMHYWHLSRLLTQVDARYESQNLNKLVRYQYALEDLRKDVDEIFSLSTFIGFTIMKAALCMFMFSLFHGVEVINMIPFTSAVVALIIPVYLRCANGTDLHEASESLIDSLYDHNWYEGTVSHRKVIVIMMTRANRPVILQASKLNLICVEYFKEFVLETYQIFMFLHNFST